MERTAKYLIFQHIADLLRQESRNVGVLVRVGDDVVARFFGEGEPNQFDSAKIAALPYPNVYVQWVAYWRRVIETKPPDEAWEIIAKLTDGNYRAEHCGELTNIGGDSISDVLNYAYSLLVSDGGFAEAIAAAVVVGEGSKITVAGAK